MTSEKINRSPIEDLYQEVILDHNRNPRNFRRLDGDCLHEHAYNPLCGDDYELFMKIKDGVIEDICFAGKGCAISKSSASMMTKQIKGLTTSNAIEFQSNFLKMVTKQEFAKNGSDAMGSLAIFESVGKFPVRVKCATMIWHALGAIITKSNNSLKGEL